MHPARRFLVPPHASMHRRTAAGLKKRGQTFLHPIGVPLDPDDFPRVGHPQNDDPALGIRERTYRSANAGEVSLTALEFRPLALGQCGFGFVAIPRSDSELCVAMP